VRKKGVTMFKKFFSSKIAVTELFIVLVLICTFFFDTSVIWGYLVLGIIILILKLYLRRNNLFIVNKLRYYSNIIFGFKRRGKDLLLQLYVILRFKKIHKKNPDKINYVGNIDYGYGFKKVEMKDLLLTPNTYNNLIMNDVKLIIKSDELESLDLIYSDGGIFLPSTEDMVLNKLYPSFPIFYALSGQLYNMNITLNTQALDRLWKKIREQQDCYIRAICTIPLHKSVLSKIWKNIPFLRKYIFIKLRYYESYKSAEAGRVPFSKLATLDIENPLYTSNARALKKQYESEHGVIKDLTVVIKIADIRYDTRYFHELFFGKKA